MRPRHEPRRATIARIRTRALLVVLAVLHHAPAGAMVGGASTIAASEPRPIVMIVGSRGNFCTGTALAPTLILTVAHCVLPGADYKLLELGTDGQPQLRDVAEIARHPQFDLQALLGHRATADVALLRLAAPLSARYRLATLAMPRTVAVGETFTVTGYGVAVRGDGKTGGEARSATLAATGHPGTLQLRLVDAAAGGARPGLGACTGDSGAPVFDGPDTSGMLRGVVSWSTGPNNGAGCGGITGVTPLDLYASWIVTTAKHMGLTLTRAQPASSR